MTSPPTRQIVCAVRGGAQSRDTVERAIAVALQSGSRLTFFHVMDAEFLGYATHGSLRVVYHELLEMGRFIMMILCDRARARGVAHVDYLLRQGNVRGRLHDCAVETEADLMVMGRPAKSSRKNLFKAADFSAFVAELEKAGNLRVIQVESTAAAEKDLRGGLVL